LNLTASRLQIFRLRSSCEPNQDHEFNRNGTNVVPFLYDQVACCRGTRIDISLRTDPIEVLAEEREELCSMLDIVGADTSEQGAP